MRLQIGGLLEAFQGREWVPVSSILARLTSSSAFGASAARVAGSSSVIFQVSCPAACPTAISAMLCPAQPGLPVTCPAAYRAQPCKNAAVSDMYLRSSAPV